MLLSIAATIVWYFVLSFVIPAAKNSDSTWAIHSSGFACQNIGILIETFAISAPLLLLHPAVCVGLPTTCPSLNFFPRVRLNWRRGHHMWRYYPTESCIAIETITSKLYPYSLLDLNTMAEYNGMFLQTCSCRIVMSLKVMPLQIFTCTLFCN